MLTLLFLVRGWGWAVLVLGVARQGGGSSFGSVGLDLNVALGIFLRLIWGLGKLKFIWFSGMTSRRVEIF